MNTQSLAAQAGAPVTGETFALAHLGPMAGIDQYKLELPFLPRAIRGKVFLKDLLGLTSMEVSFNKLPPGAGMPFLHRHRKNEELYIFLGGKGQFMADDQVFDIEEGSVIRVAPNGARAWRNTSDEPLTCIVIQAVAGSMAQGTIEDGERLEQPLAWPEN